MVKNLPANAGDEKDVGLIPESGRAPGGGHGNPLHHDCLGNPTDRGAHGIFQARVLEWGAIAFSVHISQGTLIF